VRLKHVYRRRMAHEGYNYTPKIRTNAIKRPPTHGVLPPAPKRKQPKPPVLNYPPRPTY
jgi:hypothetical protein